MWMAEVLGKFPVMQHLPLGTCLDWAPAAAEAEGAEDASPG